MVYKVIKEVTKEEYLLLGDLGLPVAARSARVDSCCYIPDSFGDYWDAWKVVAAAHPYLYLLEKEIEEDV